MSMVMAVAAGDHAVDSLRTTCEEDVAHRRVWLAQHDALAVAWAYGDRWVTAHDDGEILVVLDGRLHNKECPAADQPAWLADRYRQRGASVAAGVLGDYVFVVLDRRRASLLVARDPVGVRPWFQAIAGRQEAGATRIANLTRYRWVDTSINEQIAVEYLAANAQSRGETLYRGIGTLRPGSTRHVEAARATTTSHHRWTIEPELSVSWDEAVERCRALLDDAVAARLRVSGPATSQLSGGIDSSAVVGTVASAGHRDLMVGRLLFDGPSADERLYSDAVIDHWKVPAVTVRPWIPAPDEAVDMCRRLGRPIPDPHFTMFSSLYNAFLGEGRTEGLTGLGGDDAFIAMRTGSRVVSALKLRQAAVLWDIARVTVKRPRDGWTRFLRPTREYLAGRDSRPLPHWVTAEATERAGLALRFRRAPERITGIDAIDDRLANPTSGYLAAILEDAAAVTDEVGWRSSHPFLDVNFINGTYGLDPWWPIRGGHYRALEIDAYRDRLPAAVVNRRSKAEFSEVFWPQVLDGETLARIRTGPSADAGWLRPEGFDALVRDAEEGKAYVAIPLFRCVNLDRWMRIQRL